MSTNALPRLTALAPLGLFLVVFLGAGLYFQATGVAYAFYQVPAPVAILPAIVLAIVLARGQLNARLDVFVRGAGDANIVTMCLIYLLAGAFGEVAKSMGGVEATVNLGLSLVPASLILPGIFVIAAFIATAMGTSMGTVAAVTPIAVGLAEGAGLPLPVAIGAVLGGAAFGDNLSMISDTTIAATRTQGADMRDKFRQNFALALPAALLTIAVLAYTASGTQAPAVADYELLKVLPYAAVLVLALTGMNVFAVLLLGIALAAGVGLYSLPEYSLLKLAKDVYAGYGSMQEIFILSFLIGGLSALTKSEGGLAALSSLVTRLAGRGARRAGELGIAALVGLCAIATANNTVSIIIAGDVVRDLAERNGIGPGRSASLLDIFACVVQGLLPYGAQALLAGSIAKLSPLELVGYAYYPWLLGLISLGSIAWQRRPVPRLAVATS